ncbi:VOC family protein [Nakamurella sp. GG22]
MNQLDHLIVFLPGPELIGDLFPGPGGLELDQGRRHDGQGTRNRRAIFANCYLELLWVDDVAAARRSGLRFEQRCTGGGCPFGVVYRGEQPTRNGFTKYTVPGGPVLQVLDDPQLPFLAVDVADELSPGRTHRQIQPEATTRLAGAVISCSTTPSQISVSMVSFVAGHPQITLELTGRAPLALRQTATAGPRWDWV